MVEWREKNDQAVWLGLQSIQRVPFTRAVMLTGSWAESRGTEKSDIDFFVQVEGGHIWLTRFLVTLLLQLRGLRRTDSDIAGKICLNWFATFNAPAKQAGRVYQVLWQEEKPSRVKSFFEFWLSVFPLKYLESLLKKYQIQRIERDGRTHQKGSQVRCSDDELGFHPPKQK